jgi:hypothetical protein
MSTITVSVPDSLRVNAERLAREEGISFSQLVCSAVGEKLAALEGLSPLKVRAERGRTIEIDKILAKIPPTLPAEPQDRKVESPQ